MSDDIEQIVQEAKGTFDLDEVLTGRPAIKKTTSVPVYLDEEVGELLGGFDIETGLGGQKQKVRWGVLGKIDEKADELKLIEAVIENADKSDNEDDRGENYQTYIAKRDELLAEIKELGAEARKLQERLEQSALIFEIRYLPPIITKSARVEARKELGIKKVTDETYDDYLAEFNAQILTRATVSITKAATGQKNEGLSIEGARKLLGQLPSSEQARLDAQIDKIVFKSKIAQHLSLDADF